MTLKSEPPSGYLVLTRPVSTGRNRFVVITTLLLLTPWSSTAAAWEYCFLFIPQGHAETQTEGRPTSMSTYARICYTRPNGCQWQEVRFTRDNTTSDPNDRRFIDLPDDALSRALTLLGDAGWEMIGDGAGASLYPERPTILYFKRVKRRSN